MTVVLLYLASALGGGAIGVLVGARTTRRRDRRERREIAPASNELSSLEEEIIDRLAERWVSDRGAPASVAPSVAASMRELASLMNRMSQRSDP